MRFDKIERRINKLETTGPDSTRHCVIKQEPGETEEQAYARHYKANPQDKKAGMTIFLKRFDREAIY